MGRALAAWDCLLGKRVCLTADPLVAGMVLSVFMPVDAKGELLLGMRRVQSVRILTDRELVLHAYVTEIEIVAS